MNLFSLLNRREKPIPIGIICKSVNIQPDLIINNLF